MSDMYKALLLRGGSGGGGGGGSGMELVKSWTEDKYLVEDNMGTIPSYSTSSQNILSSSTLEQVTLSDMNDYYYFLFTRALTIPIYDTSEIIAGMQDYHCYHQESFPYVYPNNAPCILDAAKTVNMSTYDIFRSTSSDMMVYWRTSTAASTYTSSIYGPYQNVNHNFSVYTNELTIKSPRLAICGNTTYFKSAAWDHLTDIRYQYIIELYKTPKETGFNNLYGQFDHIMECAKSADHKLT